MSKNNYRYLKYKKSRFPTGIIFVLITLLLAVSVLFMIYLYRNDTFGSKAAKTDNIEDESFTDDKTFEITSVLTETAETATSAQTTAETLTTGETTTEATEATTEPVTEKPTQHDFSDVKKDEIIQKLFDEAVIYTDENTGEEKLMEKPPAGRDEVHQKKIAPLCDKLPYDPFEFFNESIFLGDSVTTGFDLWRNIITFAGQKVVENVNVIAVRSYGVLNALAEINDKTKTVHPLFEGKQIMPEDYISRYEAKRVFIFFGLNDVERTDVKLFLEQYKILLDRIKEKNPEKQLIIMAINPMTEKAQKNKWTIELVNKYNDALIDFAAEQGLPFLDYAAVLRDEKTFLRSDITSDHICHIEIDAYKDIISYILYHSSTLEK